MPYAGGQVATGGQLGLLGRRGVMDTPFNQTNFTAELIQNQQARTIADVLLNDPSVRLVTPAGNGTSGLFIRGFYYDSSDYALNGLYGIAPFYSTGANFAERVELLKGPSALLNGIPPAGSIGGSVNIVTKHAPDIDITQLTATYASQTQFGTQVDVSRRYGADKEWGVRFNGAYANGNTAYDHQKDEFGNAVLGLDYRSERFRWNADVGYQTDDLNPPLRQISIYPTAPIGMVPSNVVPPPPAAGANYMPSWAQWKPKDTFLTTKAEADLTDWLTAYGSFGYHKSTIDIIYPSPALVTTSGNWLASVLAGRYTYETIAGEAGLRASFDTGPVNHSLSASYSIVDRPTTSNATNGGIVSGNLYTTSNLAFPTTFVPAQQYANGVTLSSEGVADTMSIWDKRLQITVGARYQTASTQTDNVIPAALISTNGTVESSVWSPAYAVVFKPIEHVSLYANYIEGLQAGTQVPIGYANAGTIFPPYQAKQTEAGVKVDWGRITSTVSAFEITQPNLINFGSGALLTQDLDGKQRNRGVEVNVFGEVTRGVRLLGGIAYIDGRQTQTQGGLTNGRVAVGVAPFTANIGGEWDTPFLRDLTLTGRLIYTDREYVDNANLRTIPSWTRVDVGARYTFTSPWNGKPIVVRFNVENLFNQSYWAAAYAGGNILSPGAPRTYLASTTFNF